MWVPIAAKLAFVLLLPLLTQCKAGVGGEAQAAPPAAARPKPPTPSASTPYVVIEPPGAAPIQVRVEVVDTPELRQRGLMFRRQLEADAGMLFVFERAQHNTFWMRNTYLPLDMIFITPDWQILGIVENATPQTDTPREVPGLSQYVLEVNAGFSRQHGLTPGTKLRFVRAEQARQGS